MKKNSKSKKELRSEIKVLKDKKVRLSNSDSDIRELCSSIEVKASRINKLKCLIRNQFDSLPENPKAKFISRKPRCFTIFSSELSKCWSVGYHDFKAQYTLVVNHVLSAKNPFDIWAKLEKTLRIGSVPDGRDTQKLHPQVIENIRSVMGEQK